MTHIQAGAASGGGGWRAISPYDFAFFMIFLFFLVSSVTYTVMMIIPLRIPHYDNPPPPPLSWRSA